MCVFKKLLIGSFTFLLFSFFLVETVIAAIKPSDTIGISLAVIIAAIATIITFLEDAMAV